MDEIKVLKYEKCCLCLRNHKISSLIELNTNALVIEDENLLFSELILDVCFFRVDSTRMKYICEGCKEQLVMFHMFKRDIKKYASFHENIKKLNILLKIDDLLNNITDISDLSVYQHDNTILITKNVDEPEDHQADQNCIIEDDQMMIEEESVKCDIEEEYIDDEMHEEEAIIIEEESPEKSTFKTETEYSYKEDSYNSSDSVAPSKPRKKYHYKINTNDNLTPEQIAWIKDQVSKSVIIDDGRKVYKCQICGTILQISGSLKKHLRDSHILKSKDEELEKETKKAFKDEIAHSKVQLETNKGIETIWKCQRCTESKIFRSESGLKVHLRYNHIRNQVIDAEFIASCKISIETENSMLKNAWQCPECGKVLKSRDGLRNHLKLEHEDLVDKIQCSSSIIEPFKSFRNEESRVFTKVVSLVDEQYDNNDKKDLKLIFSPQNQVVCEPCGLQFINGSTKREKSQEIHQQLHIILKVVSQSYELPKCDQCKIMFSNNEDLATHLINHNAKEIFETNGLAFLVANRYKESTGTADKDDSDKWKCGHCLNVRFNEEIECIEHEMIVHSKQLICPIDYLEFNGIRGISQFCTHMKNKHPEMFPEFVISCTYCGQEFANIFDKLYHMKNCEHKEFSCDHCPKKFFTKNQLLRHLKIVSGAISFTCDQCFKKCASAMDLKLHYRTHTNEKTYKCSFPNCTKVFKTPAARSSHMEIHSFIEYECTDCKAIFKQRSLLKRHLKRKCKGNHYPLEDSNVVV